MLRRRVLAIAAILVCFSFSMKAQNISLKLESVSVKDAINAVSQETGYSIVIDSGSVDLDRKVTINARNASIKDVVNQIFTGQDISFAVNGKIVSVEKKHDKEKPADQPKAGGCSGKVMDASGEPLVGVVVVEKNTSNNTITDLDGNFYIRVRPGATLVFSCLGYQEVDVTASPLMSVSMAESVEYLDEAVAIGYGTMKKKDLTGAIAHVNALETTATAPRSVNDVLRGRVAGLHLWQGTDVSGNSATIKVRAQASLSGATDALIVLDGAVFTGTLGDINPADIESIDVMKDASAAAIYGSNAATGVILITTKKGETGKPKINFSTNLGIARNWSRPQYLNAEGFLNLREQVGYYKMSDDEKAAHPNVFDDPRTVSSDNLLDWYNYNRLFPATEVPVEDELITTWLTRLGLTDREIECYNNGITTDWADYIYPKAAIQQQYQVSVSNRNEKCSYFTSVGYTNKEGTQAGMGYKALNARVNIDTYVTKWLTVGMTTMFTIRDNSQVQVLDKRASLSPYTTNEIDNPDSPYFRYTTGVGIANPFLESKYFDKDGKNLLANSNVYARISLPLGFEFKSTFTPTLGYQRLYTHQSSENPAWVGSNIIAKREHTESFNWQIDNVLSWSQTFGDHRVEASFIQNAEKRQAWYTRAYGWDFSPSDALSYHGLYNAQSSSVGSTDTYQTADALVGRLFYQFKGRYMFNATVRHDGYSGFGADYKRGTFPAISAAWTFSEEPFAKGINWLNYGKLRLSWGINGHRNGSVGLSAINSASNYLEIDANGNPIKLTGMVISASNSGLRWEKTEAENIGLDFGLFKGLIDGTVDLYTAYTTDLIATRTMPTISGFGGTWDNVSANVGSLRNKGLEVTVNIHPFRNQNFKWDTSVMFETFRRKLISLGLGTTDILDENGNVIGQREADDVSNGWYIGHDPDEIRDYVQDGVWQVDEAAQAEVYGCKPGDFKYVDQDGDGVLNDADKVFTGRLFSAPYIISWNNTFTLWKDLTFSFMMYAHLAQWGILNEAANQVGSNYNWYDQPIWTEDNPIDDYARINSINLGNHWVSRSFIRMDNITLNYNLPKNFLKKINIQSASLSLSARNPFMITKWPFGDPENYRNYVYGLKTYNLGINITL